MPAKKPTRPDTRAPRSARAGKAPRAVPPDRPAPSPVPEGEVYDAEQLVLSDLINRVLDKGVVLSSHITISIADIDLIQLDLKLLISSMATLVRRGHVSVRSAARP